MLNPNVLKITVVSHDPKKGNYGIDVDILEVTFPDISSNRFAVGKGMAVILNNIEWPLPKNESTIEVSKECVV